MQPFVDDQDFRLYVGDCLDVLQGLPDESVDCVVTSPPYWGLRDYGTGEWEGGNPDCDHRKRDARAPHERKSSTLDHGTDTIRVQEEANVYRDTCGKCGAHRVDQQLGLEPTPDAYVARMVEVFREVRRVLARHGTCWVNLGSSYATGTDADRNPTSMEGADVPASWAGRSQPVRRHPGGFKPKDMVPIPWMVAMALQQDGWYLRSDIIWSKPNPMPESVTDRPTKAHEYVFLLTKQPRYFYDAEAIRESAEWLRWGDQTNGKHEGSSSAAGWIPSRPKSEITGGRQRREYDAEHFKTTDERNTRFQGPNPSDRKRNARSVWEIATQPYPEAHFATFPEELARRCILAGCPERVCRVCGKPSERIVERGELVGKDRGGNYAGRATTQGVNRFTYTEESGKQFRPGMSYSQETRGWSDCDCLISERESVAGTGATTSLEGTPGSRSEIKWRPGVVLDPFLGSGTVALVARNHGRHAIGIELSAEYAELAAKRTRQLSLLA